MTVDHANQLDVPNVYSLSRAPGDPIGYATGTALGADPNDASFGAQVLGTGGAHGHGGYWDPGTQSLENQARIALGLPVVPLPPQYPADHIPGLPNLPDPLPGGFIR
jgi:hypothetical protein